MTGKRKGSSGKSGESSKRKKIDLEEKIKIIRRYEGGQTLSSIAKELGYATSTVNTILKDKVCIYYWLLYCTV